MLQQGIQIDPKNSRLTNAEKLMEQRKKIKQKREGLRNSDTCLSVIFSCNDQSVISGRKTGHVALIPAN